ncbi:recombinase family protein [bacterium]|nr:recombinase family protein [bacterium]
MARPRGNQKQREISMRVRNGAGKAIGYARVSTVAQGENGHSLDGQQTRLREAADREGLELIDIVVEVASGRKERDGLKDALQRIMAGEAGTLIVPKIDRLGRSNIGILKTVKQAEEEGVNILSVAESWTVKDGKRIDEVLEIRAWVAEQEAKKISERTREGLAAAKAKGVKLGPPVRTPAEIADRAVALRRARKTIAQIADLFNAEGVPTARGRKWSTSAVYYLVNRVDPAANPEGGYRGKALAAAA